MSSEWDEDIATLDLTDAEKNGLQVYRNYTRAFQEHGIKEFRTQVDREKHPTSDLGKLLRSLANEDLRLLPVLICSYADDLLGQLFQREIPDGVPGGKGALFSGYGPLSNFAGRIQTAYCFDFLSQDLLGDLNKLRKVRNDISHGWDIEDLERIFEEAPATDLSAVEAEFGHSAQLGQESIAALSSEGVFRVRLIWITARLFYECQLYRRAVRQQIPVQKALYGPYHPAVLTEVAGLAVESTKLVQKNDLTIR